ncbi:hypothetical protein FOXYS1_12549 [Fusarium oxysporum]|uniref:Uncharacterized protein n=1 Tax=Fusarium oxysporum TaxID=5507 RepID=A0A8H5A3M3_FUSOX|nr:hypothetical protein FOXYS1_12549 [Fusarium oxysporum]
MTFATRRSLRRSQTIDHDELADTKIGFIEMLPSPQPKRRGRPRKSPKSEICGKPPGSKRRGRPRSTASRIMSDKRIALKLGWRMRKSTMGKRNSDIRGACDYFADDNPARRDVIRRTMTRLRCSISTVVSEDEDGWQDYRGYDHFDDDDDDDDEYVDIATPTKRSRTPSSPSLSPKRARTAESTEPRPQSITDITNSLQSLHAQKQKELEAVTNSLDEITASIQAKEASRTNHVNAKIDRLSSNVKAYESEREKILKIRGLVEQQHEGMIMKADHFLQQYTSRLEECDKLIAQANADVLEELDQMARRDFDLRDEKKRLEGRVNEVLEENSPSAVLDHAMAT